MAPCGSGGPSPLTKEPSPSDALLFMCADATIGPYSPRTPPPGLLHALFITTDCPCPSHHYEHTHRHAHTLKHTVLFIFINRHTHRSSRAQPRNQTWSPAHTLHLSSPLEKDAHAPTHTRTHAHTQTHTRTHTHTLPPQTKQPVWHELAASGEEGSLLLSFTSLSLPL